MAFGKCEKDLFVFSTCSIGRELVPFTDNINGNSDEKMRSRDFETVKSKYQADSVINGSGAQGREGMWIV